jgi:SPP1 gp7 family putative phage head morphogenesis protein
MPIIGRQFNKTTAILVRKSRVSASPSHRPTGTDRLTRLEDELYALILQAFDNVPKTAYMTVIQDRDGLEYRNTVYDALSKEQDKITEVILKQLETSGTLEAIDLSKMLAEQYKYLFGKADKPSPTQIAASFRFDLQSKDAINYARTQSSQLITNMADEQRAVMRQVVGQTMSESATRTQTSNALRQILQDISPGSEYGKITAATIGANTNGLTRGYEKAVWNRANSIAEDLTKRGITGTKAVEELKKKTDKYADKLRKARARTIARTEMIRSAEEGRQQSWDQAAKKGLIDKNKATKTWSASPMDVCTICSKLQGKTVKFNAKWDTGNGSVKTPPAHPNCRCTMILNSSTTPPRTVGTGAPNDPFRLEFDSNVPNIDDFPPLPSGTTATPLPQPVTPQPRVSAPVVEPPVVQPAPVVQPPATTTVSAPKPAEILDDLPASLETLPRTLTDTAYGRIAINPPDDVLQLWAKNVATAEDMTFGSAKLRYRNSEEVERWRQSLVESLLEDEDILRNEANQIADQIVANFENASQMTWQSSRDEEIESLVDFYKNSWKAEGLTRAQAKQAILKQREDFLEFTREAKVSIQISPTNLDSVLNDGRFLSQFESGTSGGIKDAYKRKRLEAQSFGIRFDEDYANRPIYGHLELNGRSNSNVEQYGSARVVLKDDVRQRTTYVTEDSLTSGFTPSPLTRPNVGTIQFDTDGFPPSYGTGYVETQVFGGVSIDDIQEVVFDISARSYRPPTAELLKKLDERRIPYRFVEQRLEGTSSKRFSWREVPNPVKSNPAPKINTAPHKIDYFEARAEGLLNRFVDEGGGHGWDLKTNNIGTRVLWQEQGFDALPQVLDDAQFSTLETRGWTRVFRGINGDSAEEVNRHVAQFVDGAEPFAGQGLFGTGHYSTTIRESAEAFSKTAMGVGQQQGARNAGQVIEMMLSPDAKIIDIEDLQRMYSEQLKTWRAQGDAIFGRLPNGLEARTFDQLTKAEQDIVRRLASMENIIQDDPGRYATMMGYDAIRIKNPQISYTSPDKLPDTYYAILNRGAVAVRRVTPLVKALKQAKISFAVKKAWR